LFGFDRSDLNTTSKSTIDQLITILKQYPNEDVLVIGHTDSKGANAYNQKLSVRRASSVANYLTANGVSTGRVTTKGMGETDPIVENDTPEHRAQNRRVEFVLTANEQMQQTAEQQAN
ncbi:MAG TPA: OmpA family protein, partial [Chitinophagaceae bacterium]|nr:OmpA family protein [Chitinophagaceae bacterium]